MPFVRSCLELAWGDLSSYPVQDLGNPATGDPILACDGRTGHPGNLEPDDLEVTLQCVLSAEPFASFGHGVFWCSHHITRKCDGQAISP